MVVETIWYSKVIYFETLDDCTLEDNQKCFYLQRFLTAVENLGNFWDPLNILDKNGFAYRTQDFGLIDAFISQNIPRTVQKGKLLNFKSLLLSNKSPKGVNHQGKEVYATKDYSFIAAQY